MVTLVKVAGNEVFLLKCQGADGRALEEKRDVEAIDDQHDNQEEGALDDQDQEEGALNTQEEGVLDQDQEGGHLDNQEEGALNNQEEGALDDQAPDDQGEEAPDDQDDQGEKERQDDQEDQALDDQNDHQEDQGENERRHECANTFLSSHNTSTTLSIHRRSSYGPAQPLFELRKWLFAFQGFWLPLAYT